MSTELQKTEPLAVEVGIDEPMIAEAELKEILKRQGFAEVGLARMNDTGRMGVALKGLGVLKMQRGRALINQQRMDDAMRQMCELLTEILASNKKTRIASANKTAQTISYMSRALTDAQKFMADHEQGSSERRPSNAVVIPEMPTNKGFLPGQNVQPGVTYTMREATMRADILPHHVIEEKKQG